jgi:nitroreductase
MSAFKESGTMKNDKIGFLNSHMSVRSFTDEDISVEDERTICATAERSPTSSNLHAYSIVAVRNQTTKERLAEFCGNQSHVAVCPLFLVFCADLHRLDLMCRERGYRSHTESTELFIVATVDAALAGGRALMAAQALGLGGVMVGGIRNQPDRVCEFLRLPNLAYPVMGMSLGYPSQPAKIKPRLPLDGLCFSESYDTNAISSAVAAYDKTIDKLGHLRGRETEPDKYPDFDGRYTWSEHSARRVASDNPGALRLHMRDFLKRRGLMMK